MNRPPTALALVLFALAHPSPGFAVVPPRSADPVLAHPARDTVGDVRVSPAPGPITLDGRLGDPGWRNAAEVSTFYEASPGNNVKPPVRSTVWVTFDAKYLYIAFRCDDPDPSRVRAPAVARDGIGPDQDFVAVGLDTRGDRQSALLFFVNPRGIQGDGVRNDATGDEDFSPDFFWSSAARITRTGWNVEMRIPFSSLRYTVRSLSRWGILFYRNYPRAYRYQMFSEPMPRGTNCEMCHSMRLEGLTGLGADDHLVLAPHVTGQEQWQPTGAAGTPLGSSSSLWQKGVDVKWSAGSDAVVNFTLDPDFSQVEVDQAQITANRRFALSYPEKRPFFMEGVDLLQTPVQAAYTRTITAPRWGARVTGRLSGADYTFLTARDQGGGSVVIPGPLGSSLAPQDFSSQASILRIRKTLGASFAGLLLTDRENGGGGYNRVLGPDFQWSPDAADRISGQALFSATRTPDRPDLADTWDGRRLSGTDVSLSWSHATQGWSWLTQYGDAASGFRAEDGFVPRVGYRAFRQQIGYSFYPSGLLTRVRPTVIGGAYWSRSGASLEGTFWPGVVIDGRDNLQGDLYYKADAERVGSRLLHASRLAMDVALSVSHRIPQVSLSATIGQDFDYANRTVGRGGDISTGMTLRPADPFGLTLAAEHRWLASSRNGRVGLLFSADVARIEGLWTLSTQARLRAIAQYVETHRDPALYPSAVSSRDGGLETSLLFTYRLDWQTALYLGYADQRDITMADGLPSTGRQAFLKVSWAFQR